MKKIDIKADLQFFYDEEAEKYAQTRQKVWKEGASITPFLPQSGKILELGCGSGRLFDYIKDKNFDYIGVDLSQKLLKYAGGKVYHDDMINFLKSAEQESYDVVIAIASIQHLPTYRERILLFKLVQRVLRYDGTFIVVNRSISKRFISKYRKGFFRGIRTIFHDGRDVFVPWTNKGKVYQRFYHIFSPKELKKLAKKSGLFVEKCCYLGSDGREIDTRQDSKNTLFVGKKIAIR